MSYIRSALALNFTCTRCIFDPDYELSPCGHKICYDHYIGKTLSSNVYKCPECAKIIKACQPLKEEEEEEHLLPPTHPLDTTWTEDSGDAASDESWEAVKMSFNGQGHGSAPNKLSFTKDGFPQLRSEAPTFIPRLPPPYGSAPPSRFSDSSSDGPLEDDQVDGTTDVPRYQPPHRRKLSAIVRPESSVSNVTFQTQLPFVSQYKTPGQLLARPPYIGEEPKFVARNGWTRPPPNTANKHSNRDVDGLGAGLAATPLSSSQGLAHAHAKVNRSSTYRTAMAPPSFNPYKSGSNDDRRLTVHEQYSNGGSGKSRLVDDDPFRVDTPVNVQIDGMSQTMKAMHLAKEIKKGRTEDPNDRSMHEYTTAPKPPPETTGGPVRFNDTKMFSTAASANSEDHANDVVYPGASKLPAAVDPPPEPDWASLAVQGLYMPNFEEAMDAVPLVELCRTAAPSQAGVVKISGLPYSTTRSEMINFIGRNTQVNRMPPGSPYHAVHVLMERETGKTNECFIEVASPAEAKWVVNQFKRRIDDGRPPKVGAREVKVEYSSQDEFLRQLFPRAKHVRWRGGQPVVDGTPRRYYTNEGAAGFQGFLAQEEVVAMGKNAGLHDRSPFAAKSPCRVYENWISLLYKYPWFAVDHVKLKERRMIWDGTDSLMRILMENLRRPDLNKRHNVIPPSPALLQELTVAALTCPGFSEKQKAFLVFRLHTENWGHMAQGTNLNIKLSGTHIMAEWWPFTALGIHTATDLSFVHYYEKLFREATEKHDRPSQTARAAAREIGYDIVPFGTVKVDYGPDAGELSIAQAAALDWERIEKMLSAVCYQQASSAPASIGRGSSSEGSGAPHQSWNSY